MLAYEMLTDIVLMKVQEYRTDETGKFLFDGHERGSHGQRQED